MNTAIAHVKSATPYYSCRPSDPLDPEYKRGDKETSQDHEERTWRARIHSDEKGNVYIPATSFKNALSEAAKYLSIQIPGKGKATYTKHFEAGVIVPESLTLPIKKSDVKVHRLFLPADGKRGSGKRVWKNMPIIHSWEGEITFIILDENITKEIFTRVLEESGKFIGVGTFRPRQNGMFGRFSVEGVKWS